MKADLTSAGGIGSNSNDIKSFVIQKQVGQGMLVIQLIVGIGIKNNRDAGSF